MGSMPALADSTRMRGHPRRLPRHDAHPGPGFCPSQDLRRPSVGLRAMLPPDFRWHAVGGADHDRPNQLLLDCVEVARLYQRVDDHTWWISLNNQRDRELRKSKLCSGYGQGKAGAEIWAERHQDRLRTEVDRYLQGLKENKSQMMR